MATRAQAALAYAVQVSKGTAIVTGLKYLPLATWSPGITAQRVNDDTIRNSRFGAIGRGGTLPVNPRMSVNYRIGAFDDILANLAQNAWSTDTLKQAATLGWITMEDRQADAGSGNYILYTDLITNRLRLALQPNGFARSDWEFLALAAAPSGTATTSPVAADTNPPLDTWTGSLTYDGNPLALTSLTIDINNNLETRYKLFLRTPDRVVENLDSVTGQATIAYDGPGRLSEMLADSAHAIVATMAYGNTSQIWTFGAVKITSWDAPVSTDAERFQTIGWEADVSGSPSTKYQVVRDNTP